MTYSLLKHSTPLFGVTLKQSEIHTLSEGLNQITSFNTTPLGYTNLLYVYRLAVLNFRMKRDTTVCKTHSTNHCVYSSVLTDDFACPTEVLSSNLAHTS